MRLPQDDFADHVGLDRTYVSGIERGTRNPTLATMKRLAEGLGDPLEMLPTFQTPSNATCTPISP